jgi:hypothetical protein
MLSNYICQLPWPWLLYQSIIPSRNEVAERDIQVLARTYVRTYDLVISLATLFLNRFWQNFTQVFIMARPRTSSRLMMLRQMSRSLLLFLENAYHRSSYTCIPITSDIKIIEYTRWLVGSCLQPINRLQKSHKRLIGKKYIYDRTKKSENIFYFITSQHISV